jgi:hypothetical protein
VLPADDPLSEWIVLLAMALNDIALVHRRLARDYDSLHEHLYWLRLGGAHFFEGAKLLKRGREIPEVAAFVGSLAEDVRNRHDTCLSIYDQRFDELKLTRDVLFHYAREWRRKGAEPEPVVRLALKHLEGTRTTTKTGKLREARLLFADDVAAAIFTRAAGVSWEDVATDESQTDVSTVQDHIADAVTAFVRFANPALMEHLSRAFERGVIPQLVELVDPTNPRSGWRVRDKAER